MDLLVDWVGAVVVEIPSLVMLGKGTLRVSIDEAQASTGNKKHEFPRTRSPRSRRGEVLSPNLVAQDSKDYVSYHFVGLCEPTLDPGETLQAASTGNNPLAALGQAAPSRRRP